MALRRMLVAGVRTIAAAARSSPGWRRDLAMMQYFESDLPEADRQGMLPKGTLDYARGVIELKVKGKTVVRTRKQWVDYICTMERGFPFRSYDSKLTQGTKIHRALLELQQLNKTHPDATLDELIKEINRRGFWRL